MKWNSMGGAHTRFDGYLVAASNQTWWSQNVILQIGKNTVF